MVSFNPFRPRDLNPPLTARQRAPAVEYSTQVTGETLVVVFEEVGYGLIEVRLRTCCLWYRRLAQTSGPVSQELADGLAREFVDDQAAGGSAWIVSA